jgi:hypothetical protein
LAWASKKRPCGADSEMNGKTSVLSRRTRRVERRERIVVWASRASEFRFFQRSDAVAVVVGPFSSLP